MDGTVRDLLYLRGVRLSPSEGLPEIIGFRCLGMAEKIPDILGETGALVHIWHVSSEMLPVSAAEAERWLVDASSGRHWILSEREFEESAIDLLISSAQVELWQPDKLARWIGEAVLSGDLLTERPEQMSSESEEVGEIEPPQNSVVRTVLSSKIDLDEWLIQRGMDHVETTPILLQATIWAVKGSLISPGDEAEFGEWLVLEDPWARKLEIHDESEMMDNAPRLREITVSGSMWLSDTDLRTMLIGILEARRQKQAVQDSESPVRSTMLERWRFDSESAELTRLPAAIPAWILSRDGRDEILHSRNGRTYEFNSSEAP
jgi:hypothetical protein